jgi:hypothetical protein
MRGTLRGFPALFPFSLPRDGGSGQFEDGTVELFECALLNACLLEEEKIGAIDNPAAGLHKVGEGARASTTQLRFDARADVTTERVLDQAVLRRWARP